MRTVVVFTIVYTIGLFAYGQAVESALTNLYTGINVGLFILFAILNRWAKWPAHALWAMSLIGLGNMAGGVLLVGGQPLYIAEVLGPIRYDKVFHAVAAAGFVVIAWEAMKKWAGEGYHEGGLMMLTWLVVMGGGAVVEIAELIGSVLSEVSVGDYGNNALDLVANGVGAVVGIALVWWYEQRQKRS
ncbi:MAG: hypothetical protein U9N56_05860 [Actinomycetota bacterium]|nr:hypothetical protein [Actinomycetota bacterium]